MVLSLAELSLIFCGLSQVVDELHLASLSTPSVFPPGVISCQSVLVLMACDF